MLPAILTLLLFQALGELLMQVCGLPIPGPVVGMALLLLWLLQRGELSPGLGKFSRTMIHHMGLFFVPAGVGVMVFGPRLSGSWKPLVAVILLGTLVTLVVTAWSFRLILRWQARREGA